jgi:hypothetical protein
MCVQCSSEVNCIGFGAQYLDPNRFRCHACKYGIPVLFRTNADLPTTEVHASYDPEAAAFPDGY